MWSKALGPQLDIAFSCSRRMYLGLKLKQCLKADLKEQQHQSLRELLSHNGLARGLGAMRHLHPQTLFAMYALNTMNLLFLQIILEYQNCYFETKLLFSPPNQIAGNVSKKTSQSFGFSLPKIVTSFMDDHFCKENILLIE